MPPDASGAVPDPVRRPGPGSARDSGRSDASDLPRRFGPYPWLALLGALPLLALAFFAHLVSARAIEELVHAGNDATATITGALVEREFEQWTATLSGIADFPTVRAAVASGDVEDIRQRLRAFVEAHERLDRAFVTDTTGLLWSDYPPAPESLGQTFDDRDWYRGVSDGTGPYVSEVYRRNAEPRLLLVAVAVPVVAPDGSGVAGFLVAQVLLGGVSDLLRRVEVGEEGLVLLVDHTGALVAHPGLDLQQRVYRDYAAVPAGLGEAGGGTLRGEYTDPFTDQVMLASALPVRVQDHRWVVMSQQPVRAAFAATRALAMRLAAAGATTALLLGAFLWALGRENTRRSQAEKALEAMNRELERRVEERTDELRRKEEELLQAQKMEAVGQLAGGVAHDFNNLLSVILGSTEFALEGMPDDAPERRDLENIRTAGESAAELTRQLLAFSRKQVMKPEVLDVNEAVDRMRGILERVLGEDIDLLFHLSPDLHPVKFDPGQIEQVVLNLAVNARDAMPEGGKLTVTTGNVELDEDYVRDHPDARTGPHVVLAVTDTGKGMGRETRKRIFEPFFTTKKRGSGTGLGLSTVYGVVRQGGGNIWVYSEPGRGTTFKVYLPRTDDVPSATEEPPEWEGQTGSGLVLVVEDDPGVRDVVQRILRRAGYDVLGAGDLESARSAMGSAPGPVDLLLTDVILSDTTGPELAKLLRKNSPQTRVLYMSGYTDDAIVRHGVLEAGTAFIEKPFRPRGLLKKVWEVMSQESGGAAGAA